jgi:subtilisin family serine protease
MLSGSRRHAPAPIDNWVPYAHLVAQDQAVANFGTTLTGKGIGVAIIDRGIDANHPQLVGKVVGGYNFRDNNTNTLDDYGHGTGIAGIIAASPFEVNGAYDQGVAPAARLFSLKQESSADIKAALDWVIKNRKRYNVQVVNVTDFVLQTLPGASDPTIYLPELQALHDQGVFISTPVGNDPGFPIDYPALSPYVTAVGGVNAKDQFAPNSRRGPAIDLLGPSVNVTMPYYQRNLSSTGYDTYDDNFDGTPVLTTNGMGTSWGSAYVAGTAALLKQLSRKLTPDQIQQILQASADVVVDPSSGTPYGRLNVERAIEVAYERLHKKLPKAARAAAATFSAKPMAVTSAVSATDTLLGKKHTSVFA